MELLNRVKSILFNPKEEWEVIEVENEPHAKVFMKHLLILALIPALAFFANEYLENRSMYNDYLENGIANIESNYNSNSGYYNNAERQAEQEILKSQKIAEFEENAEKAFLITFPFSSIKWNIIFAACLFGIIVAGAYVSAAIINALANQFGSEKDFNRAFSLVVYSYTPFCIAGVLYFFDSFASFVPYIGLYGLFLLYLGVAPLLKPVAEKKTTSFIIAMVVVVGVWFGLARVAVPEIQKRVMTEEYINVLKDNYKGNVPLKIDAKMRKSTEKQMESEVKNHKY